MKYFAAYADYSAASKEIFRSRSMGLVQAPAKIARHLYRKIISKQFMKNVYRIRREHRNAEEIQSAENAVIL